MTAGPLDLLPNALRAVAPDLDSVAIATWTTALAPNLSSSGISTEKRIAMFLGQVAAESGAFTRLEEDLDYTAERLTEVWPNRFPTVAEAAPYAHQPEKLANHVYAGRLGNGDEASGDGWMFRGRGLLQLTGRSQYAMFATGARLSIDAALAFITTPAGAALSACRWWATRGHMMALSDDWDVQAVTLRVNGSLTDLPKRIAACGRALAALAEHRPAPPPIAAAPPAPALSPEDALMQAELDQLQHPSPAKSGTQEA